MKCVHILLCTQGGATVDAVDDVLRTPLHVAAYHDKTECVKMLLER